MEAGAVAVHLVYQDGVQWTGYGSRDPDLLIYCTDGVLAANQVQLAAASDWLKQLLKDDSEVEESRIRTILLPFVTAAQMKQVLELICSGSVVLEENDISGLVEVSSLLGCIGDMLKEPVVQTHQILGDVGVREDELNIAKDRGAGLEEMLTSEKSISSVLDQIHQIQQQRLARMEQEEEEGEHIKENNAKVCKVKMETKQVAEEVIDSDEFVVSDDEFDDEESWIKSENNYRSSRGRKKVKFDLEEFEEALIELGESSAAREGLCVQCGLCDKVVTVPEDRRVKNRLQFFKKNHYNKCLKKRTGGGDSDGENKEEEGDEDSLLEVYNIHCEMKAVDNNRTAQGRRKAEVPPLQTIKSFLLALGGATIVNKGHQIKCGLCENKLRVNIGRTIMGNIRYFERTHLLRCPVRIAQTGKPTELISESFLPGRTPPTRVLKSISVFDNDRAEVVTQLMGERDVDFRRTPGRPRKDEEVFEHNPKFKREYYISKRKQCLAASTICFTCSAVFETGPETDSHFFTEHPETEKPFYCLACQEYFKTHDELLEHLDVDHNYKQVYTCPFCEQDDFLTQSKLNRHISDSHPNEEMLFTCTMCTKGFISFHSLKSHMKTHTNIEPDMMVDPKSMLSSMQAAFDCRFCGINIMYGKHLDQHIRSEHAAELEMGERAYHCKLCSHAPFHEFYHLENHLRNHGITIDHICRFCRSTNYNRNKFVEHFKEDHPGQPPYECPRYGCDKTFIKKQKQQDHIVLHKVKEGDISEDMKKLCVECGKVFYVRKKLEQHVKLVHGGVGLPPAIPRQGVKHQCHLCVKAFSNNALLQGHIRKHENNPCFMCDHCGKGFYRKDRLAVHTRSVHLGQKNFQCEICEKKFIDSYKLRRHMKTHTSGRGAAAAVASGVSIVTVPMAVSYETIEEGDIVRKQEELMEADQPQHVTIQHIGAPPTILQVVSSQPHHIAKRTTIQNFLKFEGEEVVGEDQSPVDFTQQPDSKIHTQYILNTQLYQT